MKNIIRVGTMLSLLGLFVVGCATTTQRVDLTNDTGPETMGLDYRDFEQAARETVSKMIASGNLNKPGGGRYVLTISSIRNRTSQYIDTDQLAIPITEELQNSGKVVLTTAVGANGARDAMSHNVRDLRMDDEFDQSRVAKKGQMIAPDFSLAGKIIERTIRLNSRQTQVEYYLQLSLTEVNTGLAYWNGQTRIVKRGSSRSW